MNRRHAPLMSLAALGSTGAWWVRRRQRRPAWLAPKGVAFDGPLHGRTLGTGSPIVLLHGLLGSGRFWSGAYDTLADSHRLVVPDLLGFGQSPKPYDVDYTPTDHARAVVAALDQIGATEPATLVAHSLGVIIALRFAYEHPTRVANIVGFGPPLYRNGTSAKQHISGLGGLTRLLSFDTPLASRTCEWMCDHRHAAAKISRLVRPDLPPAVATDAVQHNWAAYSRSTQHTLIEVQPVTWLPEILCPIVLVAGTNDPVVDLEHLHTLAKQNNIEVSERNGGHDLPLRQPAQCIDLIRAHSPCAKR